MNPPVSELKLRATEAGARKFLEHGGGVVPSVALVERIAFYYPEAKKGCEPCPLGAIRHTSIMEKIFLLSDLGIAEVYFDKPVDRCLAKLKGFTRHPAKSYIRRSPNQLESNCFLRLKP